MAEARQKNPEELRQAFLEYERPVRIQNYKVGCLLALIFMPAGASLDYFVYREAVPAFLRIRLLCSLLLGAIWVLLASRFGTRSYRVLGLLVALLPLFSIAWMIYTQEGAASPYYAGLNLVMLGAAILLRWTLADSILVFLLSLAAYLVACAAHGPLTLQGVFFNNLYFLFVTGVFIIAGSWFYNRIRFREFELRYELDRNREMLEHTNRKLVELDQVKSRFFANISHELRTPLTLVLAPLESLLADRTRAFDAGTRELFATMHASGMRLLKLINDLLDLVRLESGVLEVKREPLELASFARGLIAAIRKVAEDKHLQLQTSVGDEVGVVLADRDKLEKILLNLLFNALKFTPAGGRVQLQAQRHQDQLVLRVRDTGMGIADNHLPFIFDRFWQADTSSKRKFQGAGIGLALVKELVEVQDGTVTVDSRLGSGTEFTVQLPFLRPPETPAADEARGDAPDQTGVRSPVAVPATENRAAPLPPGRRSDQMPEPSTASAVPALAGASGSESNEWLAGLYRRAELFPAMTSLHASVRPVESVHSGAAPRVLIADDEPDMLRFLKSQLDAHFQVLEAVDGQQAIDKAAQFLPDIVVCDMMMPEMDGLQVCRALRERTSTQSIPIVLLTARADDETKLAALAAGASDFLTKPFSTTELHVRLKNLVESYHFQRKLAKQNRILEATLEQLKDTQAQLVQSEKLASLGRLSAGIIHEINNPLNYVSTGVYTLKAKRKHLAADQQADYDDILHDVENGIDRVKTIVSDLRSFTHPNHEAIDEVRWSDVVEQALRFLSHEWKDKVRVECRVPQDLAVRANRNQLVQVLVNLMQNALDSLGKKTFAEGGPTLEIEAAAAEGKTRLVVRDNGLGIAPEHADKIFDPFFTTKDVGEGMGLGLSICYRIVQGYGGVIRVRSEPGTLCEFTLEFPDKVP